MVEVDCPVDGCGYTGTVGAVEAHISGSTSGDHEGEVGRHHREALVEQAEDRANGSHGGDESEDGTETGEGRESVLSVADDATEPVADGDGLPVPVAGLDPRIVLAVLSVGALLFLVSRAGSSTSTAATSDQDRDQDRAVTGGALSE